MSQGDDVTVGYDVIRDQLGRGEVLEINMMLRMDTLKNHPKYLYTMVFDTIYEIKDDLELLGEFEDVEE